MKSEQNSRILFPLKMSIICLLRKFTFFSVAKVTWVHGAEAPGKPLAAALDKYCQTIEDNLTELLADESSTAHNDQ